jgi:hypothetical protein
MKKVLLKEINLLDVGNEIQLVGGLYQGQGKNFLVIFPDEDVEGKETVAMPLTLTEWEQFLKQSDLMETEVFANDPSGIKKAIVRKSQRQIDGNLQWSVFRRDGYKCRYCGRTGVPLTIDHIDRWENGGATVQENLFSACRPCNRTRGNMEYEEWIKSPEYLKSSQGLDELIKHFNLDMVNNLPHLRTLRVSHIRSR